MEVAPLYCAEQIKVPEELSLILKNFAKEVIRNNPPDIYVFSKSYFRGLAMETRASNEIGTRITKKQLIRMRQSFGVQGGAKQHSRLNIVKLAQKNGIDKADCEAILGQLPPTSDLIDWQEFLVLASSASPDAEDLTSAAHVVFDVFCDRDGTLAYDEFLVLFRYLTQNDDDVTPEILESMQNHLTAKAEKGRVTFKMFFESPPIAKMRGVELAAVEAEVVAPAEVKQATPPKASTDTSSPSSTSGGSRAASSSAGKRRGGETAPESEAPSPRAASAASAASASSTPRVPASPRKAAASSPRAASAAGARTGGSSSARSASGSRASSRASFVLQTSLAASADVAWERLGSFDDSSWQALGYETADGGNERSTGGSELGLVERLVSCDTGARVYTYNLVDASPPLKSLDNISFAIVADGTQSSLVWSFPTADDEQRSVISQIFSPVLDAARRRTEHPLAANVQDATGDD